MLGCLVWLAFFTPTGSLLVAQRELFEASFSNPSRARHDIT